jgi:hypothetical protein
VDVFDDIAESACRESELWRTAVLPSHLREQMAVFSPLAPEQYELGLETVYEAYLVHYGRPRLFAPAGESERILLGDYLYAHGLVRIAAAGGVDAVSVMGELIAECAALRAASEDGDGQAWVAATRALGGEPDPTVSAEAIGRHLARVEAQ